jgi:hypothetical protein
MVVDALDLCYTKAHVQTFVIISGDSDFSPLVSKLRENNKVVIGVGVKNSTSDLLIANCDEFIFYDDLVRERKKPAARRAPAKTVAAPRTKAGAKAAAAAAAAAAPVPAAEGGETVAEAVVPAQGDKDPEQRKQQAVDIIVSTVEALATERGGDERIWGSMVKQAMKRVRPGFNESYYGFRSFNSMLEEAERRGSLALERDEKSGGYIVRLAGGDE